LTLSLLFYVLKSHEKNPDLKSRRGVGVWGELFFSKIQGGHTTLGFVSFVLTSFLRIFLGGPLCQPPSSPLLSMSPAKNLRGGGEGSKKNFMKFYSRFVKILRVGQKFSKKCHFLLKKIFRGVKAKDFFRGSQG
jgi:hypothetical protein